MTCDLSTSRYLKPTRAQEKNTKTLKPWLRWDQQSSLRFACKKARLPGKASLQLNIVISLKEERLCVLAVVYSCLTRSLLVKDPDFHLFSIVVGTSILRHNTTFLSSWEELNRGLVTGIKTITYIGWLSSAAPSTFSSTDQREIGTSTGCCSLIFFGLCPWTRSIYPTYTQQLLEWCRPQLSYRNSCKTWLNTMKSLLLWKSYQQTLRVVGYLFLSFFCHLVLHFFVIPVLWCHFFVIFLSFVKSFFCHLLSHFFVIFLSFFCRFLVVSTF